MLISLLSGEARAQTSPVLYLPNTVGNNVWVIDTSTGIAGSIATASRAYGVAIKGDQSVLYVSNNQDGTVTRIDTATNTAGTPITVGGRPYGLAMTPDGKTLYVAISTSNTVAVIDTATNAITSVLTGFNNPTAVVVTPDGKTAYVTDQNSGRLVPIDIATNTATTAIAVGANPFFLAASPDSKTIYVANSGSNTVSIISTATNTLVATVTVGTTPVDVVVSPDGKTAYVTSQAGITPIDTATNTAGTPISLGGATTPFGLTVSPDGRTLYVQVSNGGGSVAVYDIATGTFGPPIAVAGGQFPGMCSNGNALLAAGLTFKANNAGALGCTLASGATGSPGPVFTGGTLQFAGANISSALPIALMNQGGTFDTAGNNATLSGAISGAGGMTKTGSGTLTLSGAGSYLGATGVNVGTLQAGIGNAFSPNSAYTIANGARLDLNGFSQTVGSLAGAGAVTLGTATLAAGRDNTSTTFSGAISGSGGLTKTGTGALTLSGANSFTGGTAVNAGTLSVNGSIATSSLTTVNASGTLGGTGTVGNTVITGGTLSPGNSIGTLNVAGNLAFSSASSYLVEVSAANADRVNVSGAAALGGAIVKASFATGNYVARQYTILNATGGVSGSFGSQVNTNLPTSFISALSYDANNVYLNLALNYAAAFGNGLSSNQAAVGNAIVGYFNRTGSIPVAFGALTPGALTQVSGETAASVQQPIFMAATQFMGTMSDPAVAGRGGDAPGAMGFAEQGDAMNADAATGRKRSGNERDAYAMITKAAPRAFVPRWNVWVSGFGGTQTTDGNVAAGTSTSSSRIGGVAVGADYWLSAQTVAGFAMAGGATNFSVAGGGGRSDLFQLGGFVRHNIGSAYITASAAYGWQQVTTERHVDADALRARFDTNSYSARLEAGNRYATPWLGIALTPYAAAQITYLDLPSYAETSASGTGSFALAYAGKGIAAPRSELGLRSDKSFAVSDALLTLRGRAAWAHDFNTERSASATFQSLPGASFVVNGARPARDAALTTAEAELRFVSGISIGASFEGEFSEVTRSYAGKGVVRYAW
ncbi:autotransporter domain-containing protein [Tardiphaga sp.]|uniref:autotransporter domain-containing protein n=1 Tax=Tardiphaga sp. TaxID=1926292 RepID=UPI0025F802BE|nr:autotransporter domain-containing protein [Tardiphaga sp.]